MKKHSIGLVGVIALVVSNMVGSGIFLLPSSLANIGAISIYSWLITTVGAMSLMAVFIMCYFTINQPGGLYVYINKALGEFMGFQAAWFSWIAIWIGNCATVLALVAYLNVFFPIFTDQKLAWIPSVLMIWILTIINLFGIKKVNSLQIIINIIVIIPMILISIFGYKYINPEYYTSFYNVQKLDSMEAIFGGITITLWAFLGIETSVVPTRFIKNAKFNVLFGSLIGLIIVALIYISTFITIIGVIPATTLQMSTAPFVDISNIILGTEAKYIVAAFAIIACFGSLNGWVLIQGQIAYTGAEHNIFPKIFKKTNKHDMPIVGLLVSATLSTIVLVLTTSEFIVDQFQNIIILATFTDLLPYLYVVIAFFVLIKQKKIYINSRKKFLYAIIVGIIALLYSLIAIFTIGFTKVIIYYIALSMLTFVIFKKTRLVSLTSTTNTA